MNNLMKEVGELQNNYQKLRDERRMTKKAICDLVIPFRDKYNLTDLQHCRLQEMNFQCRK